MLGDIRSEQYADTIDEDWIIDYHPLHPRLLLATGGSGHAFKASGSDGFSQRGR